MLPDALHSYFEQAIKADLLICKFTIPVEKHSVKKNNMMIAYNSDRRRPFICHTKEQKNAEIYLKTMFKSELNRLGLEIITEPVWVCFHFIYPHSAYYTKKGTVSKNLPDLSNLLEMPQDAGNGVLWEDDGQICAHDGSRRLPGDSYKLKVWIFRYLGNELPTYKASASNTDNKTSKKNKTEAR